MQVLSLIGAAFVLVAYFMVISGRWCPKSPQFAVTNVLGSWMLLLVAVHDNRWGFIILNGVFVTISAWYLFNPSRKEPESWTPRD